MDNLSAADIEGNMVYIISAGIEQQIAGLYITYRYGPSLSRLISGASSGADSKMREYAHGKAGAVRAVCQACPAIQIWITQELFCISHNCITGS